jgi:hypothetical protein
MKKQIQVGKKFRQIKMSMTLLILAVVIMGCSFSSPSTSTPTPTEVYIPAIVQTDEPSDGLTPTEEVIVLDTMPEEGDWLYEAVIGEVVCANGSFAQNIQMPSGIVPITTDILGTTFWVDFGSMVLEFGKMSPGVFETVSFTTTSGPPETPISIELIWQLNIESSQLMTGTLTGNTSENCVLTHFITLSKIED